MIRTRKVKLKPGNENYLMRLSSEVNFCWNRIVDSFKHYVNMQRFRTGIVQYPSEFDLIKSISGFTKVSVDEGNWCTSIMSASLSLIASEISIRSRQHKQIVRKRGGRASRWIPLKAEQIKKIKGNGCTINKKRFRFFEDISNLTIKTAAFVQELDGWYLCIQHEVNPEPLASANGKAVGIDLGIKTTATFSDGKSWNSDFYRKMEPLIQETQKKGMVVDRSKRRNGHHLTKKARDKVAKLYRKAVRQRDHSMHQITNYLVKNYDAIYCGDVRNSFLRAGNHTKSAYDSSFYKFKNMLKYKAAGSGRIFELVNESFTTQACSSCGTRKGPKGTSGLVVRNWDCVDCGAVHDRDVNAAINIRNSGVKQHPPFAGTSRTLAEPPSQQPMRCEAGISSASGQA